MSLDDQAAEGMALHPERVAVAYKAVFGHPQASIVLAHLADTCGVTESTINESPVLMAAAEGRRQVWLAINAILNMTARDIADVQREVAFWREER